ncbi:MAG: hypothetical protein EBZ77_06295 [Chitinophagia bacterium]|nr:hypothetical protein [Chitinophagia bacterium]
MNFLYQEQLGLLQTTCPPLEYRPMERECYRWVYDTMDHGDNFKAQADKYPKVLKNKNDERKCEYWALSFHDTLQASKDSFEYLVENFCKADRSIAYTRFGTNIAFGKLREEDGVGSAPDRQGHFNFHHVKDNNFAIQFKIECPL